MTTSFQALLTAARAGDDAAIEHLIVSHLRELEAFIRFKSGRAVRARESCSDVVQSVCREALSDIRNLHCENETAFKSWLFAVALNKIRHRAEYNLAAKRNAALEVPLDGPGDDGHHALAAASAATPSRHVIANEQSERIERAMARLSAEQRDVLLQSRVFGHSHRQIAAALQKSEEAVRKILCRARARLGILLESGA